MITQVEIMKSTCQIMIGELTTNIKSGKRQMGLNESRKKEKKCLRKLNFNMKNIVGEN